MHEVIKSLMQDLKEHPCNTSSQEPEVGRSRSLKLAWSTQWGLGQAGLYNETHLKQWINHINHLGVSDRLQNSERNSTSSCKAAERLQTKLRVTHNNSSLQNYSCRLSVSHQRQSSAIWESYYIHFLSIFHLRLDILLSISQSNLPHRHVDTKEGQRPELVPVIAQDFQ